MVMQGRARRRARRLAAPQWRPRWLNQTVVTTRRLWFEVATSNGYDWVNFNYDTIVNLDLTGDALTLTFLQSPPPSCRRVGAVVCRCHRALPLRARCSDGGSGAAPGRADILTVASLFGGIC